MFDSVSILFSDVVTFTEICSRISPMEVVSMLNAMYSLFDTLTERNRVYKVETIGDAYMVVSGAPVKENDHADRVCDMALDMVEAITDLKDRSTGNHLQIRVGIHSGAVVAGIVGLKMPRYCLFGDSVNTAARMEATSQAMQIHISQSTQELLSPSYRVKEREEIEVKGKGTMKTYWLEKRERRSVTTKGIIIQEPHQWHSKNLLEKRVSSVCVTGPISPGMFDNKSGEALSRRRGSSKMSSPTPPGSSGFFSEERRIYSPITFQDVAQRSVANSPTKNVEIRECRSNSMGAVGIRNTSDMFGSLLNDTEEHFRQHRDNLSHSEENESTSMQHVKPEVKINAILSSSLQSSEDESNLSLDLALQTQKNNVTADSKCAAISNDLGNSQLLMQQDQCCPGFTISKNSKTRHQGNSCIII